MLYWTIWLSLALFVAAQYGTRMSVPGSRLSGWVAWAHATGIALCVLHIVITMGSVHGWSHEAAVQATAEQTQSIYGLRWGGGVYVNYLFVAAWAFDAWRHSRGNPRQTSPWQRQVLRVFYLLVIVNAAIVFARPHTRALGVGLVAALLYAWRPHRT